MKKIIVCCLLTSVGFNIYFIFQKIQRHFRDQKENQLVVYKKIPYKSGFESFQTNLNSTYPGLNMDHKYFIVYRWDSLLYDEIHRDQMKALDSIANKTGKYTCEYVFVTEMDEPDSKSFLTRNHDKFNNARMLFGMDDFISGLHNHPNLSLFKPKVVNVSKTKVNGDRHFKQVFLYLIMNAEGKVLYTNQNKCMIVKDTAFLNELIVLAPDKTNRTLN